MRTYWWDFADGHEEGTARMFLLHLRDFLQDHQLETCETGVSRTGPRGFAAWCKVGPEAGQQVIENVLKPSRSSDDV